MAKARGDAKLTESKLRKTNEQIHYLGQYLSTKSIYGEFLKAPNKKIFRQAHSDKLAQYEEALQILKQYSPDGKFPTMKDLRAEKSSLRFRRTPNTILTIISRIITKNSRPCVPM